MELLGPVQNYAGYISEAISNEKTRTSQTNEMSSSKLTLRSVRNARLFFIQILLKIILLMAN